MRILAACLLVAGLCSATSALADPRDIVTWGDSLTWGGMASSPPTTAFPPVLGQLLHRNVYNQGVGGQTSSEIAARQGGAPALLTFQGNLVPPASTKRPGVTTHVSVFPLTAQMGPSITGSVAGLHGKLMRASGSGGTPQLAFWRDSGGSALGSVVSKNTPFVPDMAWAQPIINVFWLGRVNYGATDRVVADTQACVDFLSTNHYVVLSVLTSASDVAGSWSYNMVAALNGRLQQTFPGHYVDVRKALVDAYDPTKPEDVANHNADTLPASLRGDELHLNDKGYAIVAQKVAAFITRKGW